MTGSEPSAPPSLSTVPLVGSGRSLMNFLISQQANGPVHLLAHSMGNVVAAEALRQWTAAGRAQPLVAR